MSGASDKARFYLEQSVPELKEYEQKKIFIPEETTAIAKKRSDFEHKINSRGSSPSDYARYAEFEINVDSLRRKRVKRLGIKTNTHTGPRRIFFILDRGTRKFPGDVDLWMQSIDFARTQKAHKKLSQTLTNVLRLHPTKSELWIYAARFAAYEQGDITEARSYMQRAMRFCKSFKPLWLEYARLELVYLSKIAARRRILGIGEKKTDVYQSEGDEMSADMVRLPPLIAGDIRTQLAVGEDVTEAALHRADSMPALNGSIPRAIFDAAMSHFKHDTLLASSFFDLVCEFDRLSCQHMLLKHIDATLMENMQETSHAQMCHIRLPLVGISPTSPDFPAALQMSLQRLKAGIEASSEKEVLREQVRTWIGELLDTQDLDESIRRVLLSKRASLMKPC